MPGIGRRVKRRKYDKERRKKQLPPKKQYSKNNGIKYRYYDWRADECVDVWGRYERVEVKVDGKWIPGTMTEEDCVVLLDYPKWRYAASGDKDIRKVDIDLNFSSSYGEDYDYEEVDVSSYFNLGETIQARISGKYGLGKIVNITLFKTCTIEFENGSVADVVPENLRKVRLLKEKNDDHYNED